MNLNGFFCSYGEQNFCLCTSYSSGKLFRLLLQGPYLHAVLGEKKKIEKIEMGRSSHCSFQLFSSNPDRKPCAERRSPAKIESVALLCGSDLCSHPLGVGLCCSIHPWGPSSQCQAIFKAFIWAASFKAALEKIGCLAESGLWRQDSTRVKV